MALLNALGMCSTLTPAVFFGMKYACLLTSWYQEVQYVCMNGGTLAPTRAMLGESISLRWVGITLQEPWHVSDFCNTVEFAGFSLVEMADNILTTAHTSKYNNLCRARIERATGFESRLRSRQVCRNVRLHASILRCLRSYHLQLPMMITIASGIMHASA